MKKWIGLSLGTLLGISHIGMIGMIARKESFPKLNLPIGEYTSYNVIANKEGYTINYTGSHYSRMKGLPAHGLSKHHSNNP